MSDTVVEPNQLVCPTMGDFDLRTVLPPQKGADEREALTGFTILLAVAVAISLAALALLVRDVGQSAILMVLAALAIAGVFFGFASAVGLVHVGERESRPGLVEVVTDQLAASVLIARSDGRGVYANSSFRRLTGQSRLDGVSAIEQLLAGDKHTGEGFYRLVNAADRGLDWEEVLPLGDLRNAQGDTTPISETEGPTDRPVQKWLRVSVAPARLGASDDDKLVVWRLTDVTEAKERTSHAERDLSRLVEHLDAMPVGVFAADSGGRLAFVNKTLAGWLNVDRERLLTGEHKISDIVAVDGASHFSSSRLSHQEVDAARFDIDLVREDGTSLPARMFYRGEVSGSSSSLGIVLRHLPSETVAQDAEAAEIRFARFFHGAPIAIATIDGEGLVGGANAAFKRMFENGRADGSGQSNLFDKISLESREAVRAVLSQVLTGDVVAHPVEIGIAEDSRRTSRLYLSAGPALEGGTAQAILYAIDTTKQKELELQFAQSQKMQAVGQLAGGIAHDFNNVLTVIIGFSDLLLANHRPTDPAFRDLVAIKQNANRAASLVRQLLAFSRRQTLRPEVLSMTDVISDLSILLSRLLGEKVELKVNHGRDLWVVKADLTQFEQVIMNLCVNARDAMEDGGRLVIKTRNMTERQSLKLKGLGVEPGEYVVCEVTDTGCGMTPDIIEKIFEPFFSTKEVGKGTGLGLSTVYGIVKQTGGYIYCDSVPGKGTTFSIYLPRHVPVASEIQLPAKVDKKERGRDMTGTGTVLLVEDEEAVRRFAVRALARQGYEVLEAGSGTEALEVMASHVGTIDLVVSDIVMPEMDGPTLLKELRKKNPDLRFIFISGYAEDALSSLDENDEFGFLPKPFQLKELVAKVKETITR